MKWPEMNPLKLPSETISVRFLLLLQSFWVVTWPVYHNFEFGAKNSWKGPKWPKMAWMPEKWQLKPSPLEFCFSCGHFQWSYDLSATILNLRWNLAKNGQNMPKKAPNDQKWPECLKSEIRNHVHWIFTSLAVILSGHMTSLRQFWIWGQNRSIMAEKGPKWPKMA